MQKSALHEGSSPNLTQQPPSRMLALCFLFGAADCYRREMGNLQSRLGESSAELDPRHFKADCQWSEEEGI